MSCTTLDEFVARMMSVGLFEHLLLCVTACLSRCPPCSQQDDVSVRPWPADGGAGNAASIGERLGSGGGSSVSGEQQRQQQEGAVQNPAARGLAHPGGDALEGGGLERVIRVPKHQRSARTPRAAPAPALPGVYPRKSSSLAVPAVSDSGADAPATPRSPSKGDRGRDSGAGARTPRARAAGEHSGFSGGGGEERRERPADKTVRRGSGGGESGGRDSDAAGKPSAAALRTAASGSLDGRPSSQRDHNPGSRDQQPHSPRSGGGSSGAAARGGSFKSPVKSPRPRDGSAGKGALSLPLIFCLPASRSKLLCGMGAEHRVAVCWYGTITGADLEVPICRSGQSLPSLRWVLSIDISDPRASVRLDRMLPYACPRSPSTHLTSQRVGKMSFGHAAGERAGRPGSAQAAETATPPPAPVVPTELKDEELARLLHEVRKKQRGAFRTRSMLCRSEVEMPHREAHCRAHADRTGFRCGLSAQSMSGPQ